MAILRNKLRPFSAARFSGWPASSCSQRAWVMGKPRTPAWIVTPRCLSPLGVSQEKFSQDIHAQKGLTCTSCHGGDPTSDDPDKAMSRKAGWKGKIDRKQIPAVVRNLPFGSGIYSAVQPQLAHRPVGPVPHQCARQAPRGWRHEGCRVHGLS